MKNALLLIALWTVAATAAFAQLHNQGAKIVIQSGVTVRTDLAVQNTGGGILANEGTLITAQSVSNTTAAVLSGNGATFVGSNWANSATFTPGTTAVTFDQTANAQIQPGGMAFNGVTLNKAANGYAYLGAPTTVNGALTFQAAQNHLALGANNLTVNTVAGAASDRFIVTDGTGLATKILTGTAFTFPIGYGTGFNGGAPALACYAPVTVTAPASVTAQQFQAAYYRVNPGAASFPAGAPFPSTALFGLCQVGAVEYWDVNGAVPVQLTLTWDAASNVGSFTNTLSDLRVAGWNGSQWVNLGQAAMTGDLTAGSITSSLLTPNNYLAYTFAGAGPLPTITCPTSFTKTTDPNQCSAEATYAAVTSSSICSAATPVLLSGLPSGSVFPAGVNTVTWQATNTVGSMTCSFTVTVNDSQNPSIVCPSNISRSTDLNQCSAVVSYASPSFSDNCTGASVVLTSGQASGTAFPKGVNMVNWKAPDASGNSSVCGFTVTVADGQAPSITCPANIVRSADAGLCSAVATYASPTFSDNCTGASQALFSGQASGTAFQKGTNTVIWRATDGAGLMATCAFTVTVSDGQQPSITCPANQTQSTDPNACTAVVNYVLLAYSDNCAGGGAALQSGLPSGSAFPKGMTTVVWRATDAVGLTRTCTFRVTVNDTQTPTISCPSAQSVNTDANLCTAVVTYTTPTATDNCTPPPTVLRTSGLASGSAFPKGSSTVVWRSADAVGLTKTCSFTVTVTDAQLPSIVCPPSVSVTAAPGQCSATVSYATPSATDNCSVSSNFLLSGLSSGSLFPAGVTTNVWRAIDNSGGSSACTFTVTVACGSSSSEFAVRGSKFEAPTTDNGQLITMNLVPNPATTEVLVTVEGVSEAGGELTVVDAQSRLMWRQRVESSVLSRQSSVVSLTDFPAGMYFVTLRAEGQTLTKRLVVVE